MWYGIENNAIARAIVVPVYLQDNLLNHSTYTKMTLEIDRLSVGSIHVLHRLCNQEDTSSQGRLQDAVHADSCMLTRLIMILKC